MRSINKNFKKSLEKLINAHCMENESNTPDFILAKYLCKCLKAYEETISDKEKWGAIPITCTLPNEINNKDMQNEID